MFKDLEGNSDIEHLLGYSISPESIPVMFINRKCMCHRHWNLNTVFVDLLMHLLVDCPNSLVSLPQGKGQCRFISNTFKLDKFSILKWVGLLQRFNDSQLCDDPSFHSILKSYPTFVFQNVLTLHLELMKAFSLVTAGAVLHTSTIPFNSWECCPSESTCSRTIWAIMLAAQCLVTP